MSEKPSNNWSTSISKRLSVYSYMYVHTRGPTRLRFWRPGLPMTGLFISSLPVPANLFVRPGLPGKACLFLFYTSNITRCPEQSKFGRGVAYNVLLSKNFAKYLVLPGLQDFDSFSRFYRDFFWCSGFFWKFSRFFLRLWEFLANFCVYSWFSLDVSEFLII